ncbi:aldose epimerase family protein [Sinorhizobium psoraleae]|uniref:Aldose 1-epimerase n=1 Tax=Sinorhizobium psoraleae TaxID=520838 RepID=A0ABT4KNM4_9HYPH|nr:hypothetical protein [Sinorhizobium psoraleae]MCZ4093543.1 hypothetical protein [Sinorhizobium psoraleae]
MQNAVTIHCGVARAVISLQGLSFLVGGLAPTIFVARQPSSWNQSCPLMFPSCGWSASSSIEINGECYPMPVHGFIGMLEFEVVSSSESEVTLRSFDTKFTRTMFPYEFVFEVTFKINNVRLNIDVRVKNSSSSSLLPYSVGIHPGFRWPRTSSDKNSWKLQFEEAESPFVPCISSQGLIKTDQRKVPLHGRLLYLDEGLFQDEALCFLNARSRRLSLIGQDGTVHVDAPDARHWIVWSLPNQQFLALEPCTGHGDLEGKHIAFEDRGYNINLAPGESQPFRVRFEFSEKEDCLDEA